MLFPQATITPQLQAFPSQPSSSGPPRHRLAALSLMRLNRLAWHTQARWLAHSATARMAPAILGASGRMYLQGQMLQRHPKDERLSVFKAEYVNLEGTHNP